MRIAAHDPLFAMMKEQGVLYYPEVGQSMETANTYVIEFPVKAPAHSIFKDHLSAFDQLDSLEKVKQSYTEHNPSITISVGETNGWE